MSTQSDTFSWRLMAEQNYSVASAYGAMFFGSSTPLGAKQIWKTSTSPRVKFFFWLVMHGRCWIADRRFHHGLQDSNTVSSTIKKHKQMDHILLRCSFSREVWELWIKRLHLQNDMIVRKEMAMQWCWLHNRRSWFLNRSGVVLTFFSSSSV